MSDEFGLGSGALGFAVIGTDRSAGAENLFSQNPSLLDLRQSHKHSHDTKRKLRRSLNEVVVIFILLPSYFDSETTEWRG